MSKRKLPALRILPSLEGTPWSLRQPIESRTLEIPMMINNRLRQHNITPRVISPLLAEPLAMRQERFSSLVPEYSTLNYKKKEKTYWKSTTPRTISKKTLELPLLNRPIRSQKSKFSFTTEKKTDPASYLQTAKSKSQEYNYQKLINSILTTTPNTLRKPKILNYNEMLDTYIQRNYKKSKSQIRQIGENSPPRTIIFSKLKSTTPVYEFG